MDFDWLLPAGQMNAIGQSPQHGDFGVTGARIIAPGDAAHSAIVPRMALRGPRQMPPVGSRIPDPEGIRLLVDWIEALPK